MEPLKLLLVIINLTQLLIKVNWESFIVITLDTILGTIEEDTAAYITITSAIHFNQP